MLFFFPRLRFCRILAAPFFSSLLHRYRRVRLLLFQRGVGLDDESFHRCSLFFFALPSDRAVLFLFFSAFFLGRVERVKFYPITLYTRAPCRTFFFFCKRVFGEPPSFLFFRNYPQFGVESRRKRSLFRDVSASLVSLAR